MKYLLTLGAFAVALTVIAATEGEHLVTQQDKAFSTNEIVIKPGEKILFKNTDEVAHNVFSISKDNPFTIKVQQPGETTPVVFTNVGVTEVRCSIHPKMKLVVNVRK